MVGEIILKMVSVLTPDDIRQMKAARCGDEMRAILGDASAYHHIGSPASAFGASFPLSQMRQFIITHLGYLFNRTA